MTMSETILPRRPRTRPAPAELVVSETVRADDLRRMLESLIEEDCVHSWRNFGVNGTHEELLRWENERRPTKLFFFYLRQDGIQRLVAASAVADRLNREFPHDGFPVLGRCCIMPEYRSRGFYRDVLQYRLEHCRRQYGAGLNAIHIGAVNERISRVITNHHLAGWPRFTHFGEERLKVAGDTRCVGAYLLLLPHYRRRIEDALAGADAPQCVLDMRRALAKTDSGEIRNLGLLIKENYAQARQLGWFDTRETRDIEQLLDFCYSVPMVGFR